MSELQKRREHIIALRQAGLTYQRIGDELGISGRWAAELYRAGLKDRVKHRAAEDRARATLDTPVADLGLPKELESGIVQMGLTDLRGILAMDQHAFEAAVLCFPNVGRRALKVLSELRDRFADK